MPLLPFAGASIAVPVSIANGGTGATNVTDAERNLIGTLSTEDPAAHSGYGSAFVAYYDVGEDTAYKIDLQTIISQAPSASPAGASTNIQYNNGGAFGGARAIISGGSISDNGPSSGTENLVLGASAGSGMTTASRNVIIGGPNGGTYCGTNITTQGSNTLLGWGINYGTAGNGTQDVLLGGNITRNATAGQFGAVSIGYGSTVAGNLSVNIGNGGNVSVSRGINIGDSNTVSAAGGATFGNGHTLTNGENYLFGQELTSDRSGEMRWGVRNVTAAWLGINAATSVADRRQFLVGTSWATSTDASRKARVKMFAGDSSGDGPECFRMEAGAASAPMIGFFGGAAAAKPAAYTPTNVTTDRSYDANATTLDELADVVGTLIADLQTLSLIG